MSEQITAPPSQVVASPRYTFRFPDAATPGALGIFAQAKPAMEAMRRVVASLNDKRLPLPADIEAMATALACFADDPNREAVKRYIYEEMTLDEYVRTITALLATVKQ